MQETCLKGSLSVDVDQIDYGYAWVRLEWVDPAGLPACLEIDFDGWCRREWFIRSGQGPPNIDVVDDSTIRITFAPELARKLELAQKVSFEFEADVQTLTSLRRFLAGTANAD